MLLTEREVASIIRKSLSYVQHLRSDGGGPRYLKIGASVRYHQNDIDSWLAELGRARVWEFDNDDAAEREVDKLWRRRRR
jgi:predicted DNA-binding transcriptional regulator AlpA